MNELKKTAHRRSTRSVSTSSQNKYYSSLVDSSDWTCVHNDRERVDETSNENIFEVESWT